MNHHTAVSDDLVWIVDGSGSHVNVLERNGSSEYSLFQNITTKLRDHMIEMDKDGTVLITRDAGLNNTLYSLSVYFRENTKQTFKIQQRLDGNSTDIFFGWRTLMTPNGLVLVVLSTPRDQSFYNHRFLLIHIFSREKLESQFFPHHTINMPETPLGQYFGQTQIAVSADGLILIVGGEGGSALNIVYVFSRNPSNEFTLEQQLEGEEKGDWFGNTFDLSRSGNLLVVAAPYASPKLNRQGSIYLYVRNETNKYNRYSKFDGACSFEYLGMRGTIINSTESMLAIHALGLTSCNGGDAFVQTYTVS